MDLPERRFFLFGMGPRRKLLYKAGALSDITTGERVASWALGQEEILPSSYVVRIETRGGGRVVIREDEDDVWIQEDGERTSVGRSRSRVFLPDFAGHPHAAALRILHQEILVNLTDAGPLPNLFVYARPWYRDAAMMCMALERTDNLHLVRHWILGLREPFDRNNAGNREPDNLGELLYMISLAADASHPLVERVLQVAREFRLGNHIVGITDGAEHPVYQTKWLKFGLARLGLDDPYRIPATCDAYSSLFWWDYRDACVEGPPFSERSRRLYPYLGWAEDHFHGDMPKTPMSNLPYPLTWEAQASEAEYEGMRPVSEDYVARRVCAPHAWHAAEMFLYLCEREA